MTSPKRQTSSAAREQRQSWRPIAEALGVSRQAAWSAHTAAAETIDAIRSRSELTEDEAATRAAQALREVREVRGACRMCSPADP